MISLLKTLLKMEGFDVVALASDANVPDAIRAERPDVVLMDVHLSKQSGLDILGEIRSAGDINQVRIVMSSGANVREECMQRGANGFILKPYMPDELIGLLKRSLKPV
jgi:DNA-binding response OmpR family regulator